MQVEPAQYDEYIRRHNPIWPELTEVLKAHGVESYSIFLQRATGQLFAYAEVRSLEEWRRIADTEVCQRWWRWMSEIMPSNADFSPVAVECDEVFHLARR